MTTINETREFIALSKDPQTDHLIDVTFVTDIDQARIQKIITYLQDIHLLLEHLRDPEILDFLDLDHTPIQKNQSNSTTNPK